MPRSVLAIALALTLSVSAGCSLGSIGDRSGPTRAKATSGEIAALEAQVVELQRQAAMAEVEIARLERRLAELEGSLGSQAVGSSPAAAKPKVPEPDGALEEESLVEVSDLPTESDPAPPPPVEDPGATAASDATLTESAQALYDRGYTLFHRGHFVDSETAFQQFLSRYGATVLGDNAQFWIGEARYARGDVAGARSAYIETARRFPNGNKAPDALLKAGDCALELGDREAARKSFRDLLEEFPGSAAAGAARERLGLLP